MESQVRREPSGLGVATMESPRPSIHEAMRKLFFLQTMELGKLHKQIPNPNDTNSLFDWYLREKFRQVAEEARELDKKRGEKMSRRDGPEMRITGKVFSDLCYFYIALTKPHPGILFDQKRTFKVFHEQLFPKAEVNEYPLGQSSLRDHYVPDSIVVERTKGAEFVVTQAHEYTMVTKVTGVREVTGMNRSKIFEEKSNLFEGQKQDPEAADGASELLANAELTFYIPKINPSSPPDVVGEFPVEQVPFLRSDIIKFVDKNLPGFIVRHNKLRM